MANRLQIVVEFVNQRDACGNVQSDNLFLGDVIEVFDQRAQAVAVSGDKDTFTFANSGRNRFVPVGQEARDGVLQTFGQRKLFGFERSVSRALPG